MLGFTVHTTAPMEDIPGIKEVIAMALEPWGNAKLVMVFRDFKLNAFVLDFTINAPANHIQEIKEAIAALPGLRRDTKLHSIQHMDEAAQQLRFD